LVAFEDPPFRNAVNQEDGFGSTPTRVELEVRRQGLQHRQEFTRRHDYRKGSKGLNQGVFRLGWVCVGQTFAELQHKNKSGLKSTPASGID